MMKHRSSFTANPTPSLSEWLPKPRANRRRSPGTPSLSQWGVRLVAVLLLGTSTPSAFALQDMSAKQLGDSCQRLLKGDSKGGGEVCRTYIQAYVAASPRVVAEDEKSGFHERAMRTRSPGGSTDIDTLKMSRYCLPEEITVKTLAQHLVDAQRQDLEKHASELMQRVLKANYEC